MQELSNLSRLDSWQQVGLQAPGHGECILEAWLAVVFWALALRHKLSARDAQLRTKLDRAPKEHGHHENSNFRLELED